MTDPADQPDLRLDELKELAGQENLSEFLRRTSRSGCSPRVAPGKSCARRLLLGLGTILLL